MSRTINPGQVLEREESGKEILQYDKRHCQIGRKSLQTFDNNKQYAEQDAADENHIKQLPFRSIRFEDDDIQFPFQPLVIQEMPDSFFQIHHFLFLTRLAFRRLILAAAVAVVMLHAFQ